MASKHKPENAYKLLDDASALPDSPVYAVFGPNGWLRAKALKALLDVLASRGAEIRRFDDLDTIAPVLDELRTPGMFGGSSVLVIRNRRVGNRHEVTTRFKDELAAYLENPSKRNVLVFEGYTWARNLTVPKRISASFPTWQAEELKPWDYRGWQDALDRQALDLGLSLDRPVYDVLREYTGGELSRCERELEKMALLSHDGRVTTQLVAHACGFEGQDSTFALCDALLTGDTKGALRHCTQLAKNAELSTLLSLMGLLRLQVSNLGRAQAAFGRNSGPEEAFRASKSRLRNEKKQRFVKLAQNLSRKQVASAVKHLSNVDLATKSSVVDAGSLLVALTSTLCEILHTKPTKRLAAR